MTEQANVKAHSAGWRFNVGIIIIVFIFLFLLLIPLAAAMDLPAKTVATITGVVFIGNKVLLLVAIGVMGKAGFQELKRRMFSKLAPDAMVGPTRYRIGLVMFCLPLLTAMLEPYIDRFFPGLRPNSFAELAGDPKPTNMRLMLTENPAEKRTHHLFHSVAESGDTLRLATLSYQTSCRSG